MKDPLSVSPSKENQGNTRGKEKILLTSVGIEPPRSKEFFLYLVWFPDSLTRANAQWVFHGFHRAL